MAPGRWLRLIANARSRKTILPVSLRSHRRGCLPARGPSAGKSVQTGEAPSIRYWRRRLSHSQATAERSQNIRRHDAPGGEILHRPEGPTGYDPLGTAPADMLQRHQLIKFGLVDVD